MSEYNNVPRIRFKGFTDVWEQRKWIDDVNISTNMVDPKSGLYNSLPHIGPGNIESFTGQFYDNIKLVGDEKLISGKFHFYPNDIIYGKINPQLGKYVFPLFEGLCSADTYVLNAKNNLEQLYLYTILQTEKFYKYTVSVSMRSGMPKINRDELNEYCFLAPSSQEQLKIGTIFKEIDNLITLHQRKCDTLVNVKKSLLEKMFPKNSSNIPEIRFKGFTDVWEQRKLENIFNYERPDKYIVSSTEYLEFGPTPVLTANKAFILGYTTEKNKYVNSKESIIFDDFTLDTKFVDFPYMVKSSAIKILTLKDVTKDNIRFNFELLSNHKFNMLGHARHYISVVQPEEVFMPNKQEQDKIGELFTNLDNLITLHQRKLEKLNNIKKSMLDKMFV